MFLAMSKRQINKIKSLLINSLCFASSEPNPMMPQHQQYSSQQTSPNSTHPNDSVVTEDDDDDDGDGDHPLNIPEQEADDYVAGSGDHNVHANPVVNEKLRQAIIADYIQEQKEQRGMEQAIREAQIALMPHHERLQFAANRLVRRRLTMQRDLRKIADQYLRVVWSCPSRYYQPAQEIIDKQFPFLLVPRAVGDGVLAQVKHAVDKQITQGALRSAREVSDCWYMTARQYLGLSKSYPVPHPDVAEHVLRAEVQR